MTRDTKPSYDIAQNSLSEATGCGAKRHKGNTKWSFLQGADSSLSTQHTMTLGTMASLQPMLYLHNDTGGLTWPMTLLGSFTPVISAKCDKHAKILFHPLSPCRRLCSLRSTWTLCTCQILRATSI